MPARFELDPQNYYVMRCSGIAKRSEFAADQAVLARAIDAGAQPRILAILEDFEGWEKNADWDDLDFTLSYGGAIEKIAIVGDSRWEADSLAFAGAGFRRAPVKFFPEGQETQARAWLKE